MWVVVVTQAVDCQRICIDISGTLAGLLLYQGVEVNGVGLAQRQKRLKETVNRLGLLAMEGTAVSDVPKASEEAMDSENLKLYVVFRART